MPEDAISGTLARCTLRSLLTFNKEYACNHLIPNRKGNFFTTSKKEKNIEKACAAKIVSLAAFLQVRSPLFFSPKKLLHFVYLCFWSRADEGRLYDYRKNCVGLRQNRIPTHPDIPLIV